MNREAELKYGTAYSIVCGMPTYSNERKTELCYNYISTVNYSSISQSLFCSTYFQLFGFRSELNVLFFDIENQSRYINEKKFKMYIRFRLKH